MSLIKEKVVKSEPSITLNFVEREDNGVVDVIKEWAELIDKHENTKCDSLIFNYK